MTTRDDIYKLRMDDPAIHHALTLWESGDCTWEQAMMMLVEYYSKERKSTLKMLIDAKLKQPAPLLIVPPRAKESTT